MDNRGKDSALLPSALFPETSDSLTHWRCTHCGLNFKSSRFLSLHTGSKSLSKPPKPNPYLKTPTLRFSCQTCGKKFDSEQGLNQHIGKKHEEARLAVCPVCQKSFKHKHAVKFHIGQVHEKTNRAACKYCEEMFYSTHVMKQHLRKCRKRFPSCVIGNEEI